MGFLKNKKVQASLVFIIMCCIAGIFAYYWRISHQEEKIEQLQETVVFTEETTTEPVPVGRQIDFEALKKENPDIYAWIEIPGTAVDYPMLQSGADKAEDYYLNHNLDYSAGYPGCIYTQRRNKQDFSDPDTVIYGHNMKNDTMFGSLNEYKNKDYFDEHNQIIIYTPEKTYKYRIFAAHLYDDKLILGYYADFLNPKDFDDYINEIKSNAKSSGLLDESVIIDGNSKLITLSTCVKADDQRWLIQAVREDTIPENQQEQFN